MDFVSIPEKTPEKVALGKSYKERRAHGEDISGLDAWNVRWVGPDGYKGIVARQVQEFKRRQQARIDELEHTKAKHGRDFQAAADGRRHQD